MPSASTAILPWPATEIINEPSRGLNVAPGVMDATELFPLYAKVVHSVLAQVPGFRQLFFIEPNTTRDVTDQSAIVTPWSAFSSYPNVVYAPHIYTGVFTIDEQGLGQRVMPLDGGYRSAEADARALGLPLWVGEFGNSPVDDATILTTHYRLQDQLGLGGTLWLWKENANDLNGSVFWGVYGKPFGQGVPQPRLQIVSRAFPMVTFGDLRSLSYDPAGAFAMRATSPAVSFGDRSRATVVFVPTAVSGAVLADGARVETFDRGRGSREAYVYPAGGPSDVFSGVPAGAGGHGGARFHAGSCRSRLRFIIHLRGVRGLHVMGVAVCVGHRRARGPPHGTEARHRPARAAAWRIHRQGRQAQARAPGDAGPHPALSHLQSRTLRRGHPQGRRPSGRRLGGAHPHRRVQARRVRR